jgi:hypothetical protein
MASKTQSMLKASSAPETAGRRCRNGKHVSRVDRPSVKYLPLVNVHNDLAIVHSVWIEEVRGTVRRLFTNPLTAPINKPHGDHPRGRNVQLLLNPLAPKTFALRPSHLLLVILRAFPLALTSFPFSCLGSKPSHFDSQHAL